MSPVGTGIVEEEDGCGGKVEELEGSGTTELLLGAGGITLDAEVGAGVEMLLEAGGTTLVSEVGAGVEMLEETGISLVWEVGSGSLLDEVPALVGAAPEEDAPAEGEDISEVKELELFFLGFFLGVVVQPLIVRASKLSKIPEIFLRI